MTVIQIDQERHGGQVQTEIQLGIVAERDCFSPSELRVGVVNNAVAAEKECGFRIGCSFRLGASGETELGIVAEQDCFSPSELSVGVVNIPVAAEKELLFRIGCGVELATRLTLAVAFHSAAAGPD